MLAASSTASTPSSSDSCCNHLQARGHARGARDAEGRCQPSLWLQQPRLGVVQLPASIISLRWRPQIGTEAPTRTPGLQVSAAGG